ncbi:MAG: hypothetical protein HY680_05865 [Chloroflexi bacterium]|nr:hypothetical protein [Chloroflexota bacterium]
MDTEEMKGVARLLAETLGPDGKPMFAGVWDDCLRSGFSPPGAKHPTICACGGAGRTASLDLNRWLMAIGTDAEFHLLPNDQWVCTIPQTSSRSMYQPTPMAALLEAVQNAVQGL